MNNDNVFGVIIVALLALASFLGATEASKSLYITPRDYEYEHYCDSIYHYDNDYYIDVLVETDEYQNYIAEHGEWWLK